MGLNLSERLNTVLSMSYIKIVESNEITENK
jgi:hypothetical protein